MALKDIKAFIRKLVIGHDINTYYFSQSGEDAIIKGFFYNRLKNREKGFYVDVGAFHPTHGNNTYFFYINGWRGINIDASPGSMKPFEKSRKRDINLELGISKTEGELKFYWLGKEHSMNSFSEEFINKSRTASAVQQEVKVKTYPLGTILDKYLPANTPIDFLSVDVEGMDLEVLESNNWDKYIPRVIIVEMQAKKLTEVLDNPINGYLSSKGYTPYAKTLLAGNLASVMYAHSSYNF